MRTVRSLALISAFAPLVGLATLAGCAGLRGESPNVNVPAARLSKETYTSPDGAFTLRVPPLVRPGMRVDERDVDASSRGVFFADDLGTVYYVMQFDNDRHATSLEEHAALYTMGEQGRETQFVETARGRELRVTGVHKGGSPLVAMTENGGQDAARRPDLAEAASIFEHAPFIYRVVVGISLVHEPSNTEAALSDAKQRLQVFLDGLAMR